GRTARSRPGIDVHRVRAFHPDDCTVRDGIQVTTVARTLLDLAEVVPRKQVERAFDEAERLRLLSLDAVVAVLARARGRKGLRTPAPPLADPRPSTRDARSPLESVFLPFCQAHAIPLPATNVDIAGYLVDAVWPVTRLIVELDSYEFHGKTRTAF